MSFDSQIHFSAYAWFLWFISWSAVVSSRLLCRNIHGINIFEKDVTQFIYNSGPPTIEILWTPLRWGFVSNLMRCKKYLALVLWLISCTECKRVIISHHFALLRTVFWRFCPLGSLIQIPTTTNCLVLIFYYLFI